MHGSCMYTAITIYWYTLELRCLPHANILPFIALHVRFGAFDAGHKCFECTSVHRYFAPVVAEVLVTPHGRQAG